jgi:hypothetical protein
MEMEGQPGDDEIWKYLLSNPQVPGQHFMIFDYDNDLKLMIKSYRSKLKGSTANDVMAQFPELNRAALVSLLNKLTTEVLTGAPSSSMKIASCAARVSLVEFARVDSRVVARAPCVARRVEQRSSSSRTRRWCGGRWS